ncbi:HNH endonuclease signature motif containing protein [Sphingobacterium mizutaii]|uniref:HNH endonuclease signature motif containing protein n=1 Tax=Sphingobacterium mizutaii TaxID=1010 RepID=UPI003D98B3DA
MNKYGLSRNIPAPIKRQIRQESGFGCVICGNGIYEYEHIEPEYNDAEIHDPKCMTILCPSCHSKVTRGLISKKTVWEAKNKPKSLEKGFSSDWFDIGENYPFIVLGGLTLLDVTIPLLIDNIPVIKITKIESENSPWLLTAKFFDSENNLTLEIIENEWMAYNDNWDVNIVGPVITITDNQKVTVLQLRIVPPDGIIIEKLKMSYNGYSLTIDGDMLAIVAPGDRRSYYYGCISSNNNVGLNINKDFTGF